MKKRYDLILEGAKILLSAALIPLYFLKFFQDVAVYPSADGISEHSIRLVYEFSIYDRLLREGTAHLVLGAISILIVSALLSCLSMVLKERKSLKIASYGLFAAGVILFLILLSFAASLSAY